MLDLLAENAVLRILLLTLLFAIVAIGSYFAVQASAARQLTRRRLLEQGSGADAGRPTMGSLRTERVESAWLKLVNSIEKSGLSLVDSKDEALRHKLAAAGFTGSYAPRVYTLVRLVLVIGLPILVFLVFWATGSSPSLIKLYSRLSLLRRSVCTCRTSSFVRKPTVGSAISSTASPMPWTSCWCAWRRGLASRRRFHASAWK